MNTRTLTLLDATGDTTVSWTSDRDDEMELIIKKKMEEGVTFFIVERSGARAKLSDASEARRHRVVAIPDEDLRRFVEAGGGEVTSADKAPVKKSRVGRKASEVVKAPVSIGVRQMRGG